MDELDRDWGPFTAQKAIGDERKSAQMVHAETERLREAIEDAVDTLEAVNLDVDNPLYDRLRAIVDEQKSDT